MSGMTWAALILVAFVGLLLLWMPIMLCATLFSGWYDLSRRYPRRLVAAGAKRGLGTLVFSPVFQYKRCVGYAIDDDHLHLSLPPVLGIFHSSMSIPWPAIAFPAGDRRIAGMALMQIGARRILASPRMVERELEVRAMLAAGDSGNAFG